MTDPQATTREEAITAVVEAVRLTTAGGQHSDGQPPLRFSETTRLEYIAAQVLDVLLAPRRVKKCTTCWNEDCQASLGRVPRETHDYVTSAKWAPCPDCDDGFVTVPSLAILRADLEQMGRAHFYPPHETFFYGDTSDFNESDFACTVLLYRIASEEKA